MYKFVHVFCSGIQSSIADDFMINIDRFEGMFDKKDIYLKDKQLNITHNLTKSPYMFKSISGVYNDRFELIIVDKIIEPLNNFTVANSNLIVTCNNNIITVTKANDTIIKIELYDVLGKKIYEKIIDKPTSKITINDIETKNQIFILLATYSDGYKESTKIIY